MIETTRASQLALWLAAAADGLVSPDDVVDACGSLNVINFDGDGESISLALVAAFVARTPQTRVFLNLARPGDPGEWSTTSDVTARAVNQHRGKSKPKPRSLQKVFLAENGIRVTVSAVRSHSYHEVLEALKEALGEVQHRIDNNVHLA